MDERGDEKDKKRKGDLKIPGATNQPAAGPAHRPGKDTISKVIPLMASSLITHSGIGSLPGIGSVSVKIIMPKKIR